MAPLPDVDREDWTAHVAGLRRLAAHLVRDPGQADDAVQDAFVVALTRPPGTRARLGAWLRGVLRNKTREGRRGEDRRRRHEAAAPPKEAVMDVAEIAGGLEVQQRAVEAVRALDEPYRSAVWWHYFEGVDARAVAERQGVPLETARTRLKRALERLRADMDRRCGDRKVWLAALMPFAAGLEMTVGVGATASAAAATAVGVGVKGGLVVAAVLAAGLGATVWAVASTDPGVNPARIAPDAPIERAALDERSGRPEEPLAAPGGETVANPSVADGSAVDRARPVLEAPARARGATRRLEGRFKFHYKQGWSFRSMSIVPPEDADVVFETCAGGISSVTLAASGTGAGITNLRELRDRFPKVRSAFGVAQALVRFHPDGVALGQRAQGDSGAATSDVFVLRTRDGDWVRLAIVKRDDSSGGWTEYPVTVAYVLVGGSPIFSETAGNLRVGGFELDTSVLEGHAAPAGVQPPRQEGRFQFHYQQGWSFASMSVVASDEADVVFQSCAGGISSVTLAAGGDWGGITNLEALRGRLKDTKSATALAESLLRVRPAELSLGDRANGDDRRAVADVFVLRTRAGGWARLVIEKRDESGGDWTKYPVTIAYVLTGSVPEFADGTGELKEAGFEIDTQRLPSVEKTHLARAEAEREEAARPLRSRLADLDRTAGSLLVDARARDGAAVRVAAVLDRAAAQALGGDRDAYTVATYSFEKDTRDDVQATRNDWDFLLQPWNGASWIDVTTVTDDRSLIRDFGDVEVDWVLAGRAPPGKGEEMVRAVAGHLYVIHTLDTETDTWAFLRILRFDGDGGMVFAWQYVADPTPLQPLLHTQEGVMREARARLSLRGGAGGGNAHRLFLDGTGDRRVEKRATQPLDATSKPEIQEDHIGFVEGGLVPLGKVFLVEQIEYVLRADGDSNGHGEALISVGPYVIAHVTQSGTRKDEPPYAAFALERGVLRVEADEFPIRGRLAVRIPIRRGREHDVYVEIANSSAVEVTLSGRFVPSAEVPSTAGETLPAGAGTGWLKDIAVFTDDSFATTYSLNAQYRSWLEVLASFDIDQGMKRRIERVLAAARSVVQAR